MSIRGRASRYIAWVLRHGASKAELPIDDEGWVTIGDLLTDLHSHGYRIDEDTLHTIVAMDAKGRYSFSEDGHRIRANYGHSISVALTVQPAMPPNILYHGTARSSLDGIRRVGLIRRERQYVHLTDDEVSAVSIGSRHGDPVVITVESKTMYDDGVLFYPVGKHTWLTTEVPVCYLRLDQL